MHQTMNAAPLDGTAETTVSGRGAPGLNALNGRCELDATSAYGGAGASARRRTTSAIRVGAVAERGETIAILVDAFEDDAAVRTFYPEEREYRRHFPGFLVAFGGRAFEAGVVDQDECGLAAALWFPPGLEPDGAAIMAHLELSIPAECLEPLAAGMELQGTFHPHEPHWYLPWLGVRAEAQGQGVGSRLLARGLGRADADGLPVYLEATSPRNAALYARHGFEVVGVVEAPGYPEIIPMWRPAQG